MKYISLRLTVLLIISLIVSCDGDKEAYKITELNISFDKNSILNDNIDAAAVKVLDQNGANITSKVNIYAGGNLISGPDIRSSEAGTIEVYAEYEDIVSSTLVISVVEDAGLKYERMVLLEQFTATWCGFCPKAISAIKNVSITGENIVHVAYHMRDSDPFQYVYNSNLEESFGVVGFPAVYAGREFFWDLSNTQLRQLYDEVRVGLSLSYTGDDSGITATIDVRFGKLYSESLSITAYLIEDNLIADQANYSTNDPNSSWYQLGSIVAGFAHENVMRQTLTDMFGDQIPGDAIDIGSEYRLVLENSNLNITDLNNSSLLAFVSYASGPEKNKVINAIYCDFGSTAESELIVE